MDNASKALIMAGAILISIAIVSVGVFLLSSIDSQKESSLKRMDAFTMQEANTSIGQYAGTRVRGTTVKQLIENIATLNVNETFPIELTVTLDNTTVDVAKDGDSGTRADTLIDISNSAFFTVLTTDAFPTDEKDGYYDTITITSNK